MIPEQQLKAIGQAFEYYIEYMYSATPVSNPDGTVEDIKFNTGIEGDVNDTLHVLPEGIIFLDYMWMFTHFPDYKIDKKDVQSIFDNVMHSSDAYELVKYLRAVANGMEFFEKYKKDKESQYELRFFNFPNPARVMELKSSYKNTLVQVKGIVIDTSIQIHQSPKIKEWMCEECTHRTHQLIKRGEKPVKYKGICNNIIGQNKEGNDVPCGGSKWKFIDTTDYEDYFQLHIEPLGEETGSMANVPNVIAELNHNFASEKFINSFQMGDAYEITGFCKLMESKSQLGFQDYKPYIEIVSYRPIERRHRNLRVMPEEEKEIKEFLAKPDSIENLAKIFGTRVYGFHREKKFFLILKALQECYNKRRDFVNPSEYLMHLCLVGDYGTGKSELAKAFQDICDNSQYVIGSATTSAGLTGATVKDEVSGQFSISGGVLARASGDSLFLEEFDKQKDKTEFGVINECLSNYQYVITKAGKTRRFKSHTTFIVIANPKEKKFIKEENIVAQINITGDLLSRFTVISCIFESTDIKFDLEVNKIMLERQTTEVLEADRINGVYIKKCLKIASDIDTIINIPEVQEFIDNFTKQAYAVKGQVYGHDKDVWESRANPRNRHNLLKLIKGIAMLHLHKVPTKEDMEEALDLFNQFQADIITYKDFMKPMDIDVGLTLEEFEERVKENVETQKWEIKIDTMTGTKKGRRELIKEHLKHLHDKYAQGEIDINALKEYALTELKMDGYEFENLIEKMIQEGEVFQPKQGFVRLIN